LSQHNSCTPFHLEPLLIYILFNLSYLSCCIKSLRCPHHLGMLCNVSSFCGVENIVLPFSLPSKLSQGQGHAKGYNDLYKMMYTSLNDQVEQPSVLCNRGASYTHGYTNLHRLQRMLGHQRENLRYTRHKLIQLIQSTHLHPVPQFTRRVALCAKCFLLLATASNVLTSINANDTW
jgi:hypothetical protein